MYYKIFKCIRILFIFILNLNIIEYKIFKNLDYIYYGYLRSIVSKLIFLTTIILLKYSSIYSEKYTYDDSSNVNNKKKYLYIWCG